MAKDKNGEIPVYHSVTEFLKGQASRIFREVNDHDKVVIVNKQNKPQVVVISYDRYIRLKENEGSDI
ncbi:MAG: type II toxin-antitoxin system prevent-host-death family antitoxin [Eubacteriales bacterium]|nr:type II toxin-antitoxin system prevent-host-death family antitoxin [Eubacteriales bacterium]MDD4475504.1 type II toxin-antitoxin system prevent-host-death family antitoxin [Eubacteriales bacterium]